ncbi:MAG TPA: AIPR family protein [Bacillus sp. (in: firmicutes)]|nr:AIPR family protein [Bacillus sp. (in: firmicutes)]
MGVPDTFIQWVKRRVADLKSEFSIQSDRHAFAVWAIGYIHDLSDDDAFNQCDTLSQGDGGLDGWNFNEAELLFSLNQVKYPDNPSSTIGPDPVNELFRALDLVSNPKAAAERSEKLAKVSTEFMLARENGASVVLNCIVFAKLSKSTKNEFISRCNSNIHHPVGEIWDLERLYQLYIVRETIEDMGNVTISMPLPEEYISMSAPDVNKGIGKSLVVNLNAKQFITAIRDYNPRIFASNVRYHLGHQNRVNTKIKETLIGQENEHFWHYNNGITILVNNFEIKDDKLELTNLQIVNGCQTVSTLIQNCNEIPKKVKILAKIIQLSSNESGKNESLLIAEATNSQTPVKVSDLKANDPIQREIQANFKSLPLPWHYERKRGEWNSLDSSEKARYGTRKINMVDVGQIWLSFDGSPAKAVSSKDDIFSDPSIYKQVYKKEIDVKQYLVAVKIFRTLETFISGSNLGQLSELVRGFDEKTLNRLVRGKRLVVAHATALVNYILETRYKRITGTKAEKIINLLEADNEFTQKLLKIVALVLKKFVSSQPEDADIRQLFKSTETLKKLQEIFDDYLTTLETSNQSLKAVFPNI